MPLDHERGEPNPLGLRHRVVPVSKYRELPHLEVEYETTTGKQFKVPVTRTRPIYADAVIRAREAFEAKGAIFPNVNRIRSFPEDAILVQEFPEQGQVEFIFCRKVAGEEMFVRIPPYTLPPDLIGWLKATDRWRDEQ